MDEESERTSPDARDDLAVDSDTCRLDSLKDAAHDGVMSAREAKKAARSSPSTSSLPSSGRPNRQSLIEISDLLDFRLTSAAQRARADVALQLSALLLSR